MTLTEFYLTEHQELIGVWGYQGAGLTPSLTTPAPLVPVLLIRISMLSSAVAGKSMVESTHPLPFRPPPNCPMS